MYHKKARKLRKSMTDAEQKLWFVLRDRRMRDCKFRRQHPIGNYIVDFVCLERKHVLEIDGGQHAKRTEEDAKRTAWLEAEGYCVMRFWNHEVLKELDAVKQAIWNALEQVPLTLSVSKRQTPSSPQGRGNPQCFPTSPVGRRSVARPPHPDPLGMQPTQPSPPFSSAGFRVSYPGYFME